MDTTQALQNIVDLIQNGLSGVDTDLVGDIEKVALQALKDEEDALRCDDFMDSAHRMGTVPAREVIDGLGGEFPEFVNWEGVLKATILARGGGRIRISLAEYRRAILGYHLDVDGLPDGEGEGMLLSVIQKR